MTPRIQAITMTLCLSLPLWAGCGEDPKPSGPVDTLCSGDEQKCYGNALLSCGGEGKSWVVGWCGESKTCTLSGGAPGCQGVKCERGARLCDEKKVLQCPDDGLTEPTVVQTCKPNEHCMSGQCVVTACEAGTKACGWKTLLTCDNGSWQSVKCKSGQRCDEETLTCVDQACAPTSLKCVTDTSRAVCNLDGSAWQESGCGAGQVCTDGVCHPQVKGVNGVGDAGGTEADGTGASSDVGGGGFIDTGSKPEVVLEPLDILKMTISETPTPGPGAKTIDFEFSSAVFSGVTKMLQITGDQGLNKLEIQLAPVEEFTTGTFTALEAQAEDTMILMNDGSNDQNEIQWQFQAVDYTLNITDFEDIGGRVKGTFSAKLGDAINKGEFIYVEGNFDIKRSN